MRQCQCIRYIHACQPSSCLAIFCWKCEPVMAIEVHIAAQSVPVPYTYKRT
jgi:hypothetical protein